MRTKEELEDLIEKTFAKYEQAEEKDKPEIAGILASYTAEYKILTGDWYRREYKIRRYENGR